MKTKRTKITTGINDIADGHLAELLMNLTDKKLRELAKVNAAPVKKYKWDTALSLARAINAPGRGLTATVTIEFIK